MNYNEIQDFMKNMYADKSISFDFDEKCIRQVECVFTEGELHTHNHIQYEKVKVTVEGMEPIYAPIAPHRMLISANDVKNKLPTCSVYINPERIKMINDLKEKDDPDLKVVLNELSCVSGLTTEEIEHRCRG